MMSFYITRQQCGHNVHDVILSIMAGFDDDNFSLSGLMQQGHEMDVTVISSSDEDDNYGGLLQYAQKLGGDISEKYKMSTSV